MRLSPSRIGISPVAGCVLIYVGAVAVALAAALAGTGSALADFQLAYFEGSDAGDDMVTWRLYAVFSDPDDRVLAVTAGDSRPIVFRSSAPLFNDGGELDGTVQEDLAQSPISGPRDSWVTIGHEQADGNDTVLTPGFGGGDGVHSVITGTSWCESDGSWMDGDPGTPDLPVDGRVLLGQFTLPRDALVTMGGVIVWQPAGQPIREAPFLVWNGSPPQLCEGDIDGDAAIGLGDLLAVLAAWGPCRCCAADLDASGAVGFEDLLFVLGNWGGCL